MLAGAKMWNGWDRGKRTKWCPVAHVLAKQIARANGGQLFVAFQHASGLCALTSAGSADKDHASGLSETHGRHILIDWAILWSGVVLTKARLSNNCGG